MKYAMVVMLTLVLVLVLNVCVNVTRRCIMINEPLTKELFTVVSEGTYLIEKDIEIVTKKVVLSALEGLKEDMRIHFLTQYGAEDLRYKVDKWFPFLKDEKGKVLE